MNNKYIVAIALLVIILAGGALTIFLTSGNNDEVQLDAFAQCLTQKGLVMYGTYFCSFCNEEKASFGSSFKFINYIECSKDIDKCLRENITHTPAWIFPDGRKLVGKQGLQKLSQETGCPLP